MTKQSLFGIVGILFVVSGALGLVYQVVWFKYLSLLLGNTTYAQSIVVATFMAGLAIGSALWGRGADRTRHPLRFYASLEFGIGLYGLIYPAILHFLKSAFLGLILRSNDPPDAPVIPVIKLVVCFITLLPPTILMGGTLPILVRFLTRRIEEAGRDIATLYYLNSFGGVVGSLLCGIFLIRFLGLKTTLLSAALLNLVVAATAFALARIPVAAIRPAASSRRRGSDFSPKERSFALTVAGLSGLAAMVYEISWTRLLIPVLGSSTYSFTLMLASFITGITLGSMIASTVANRLKNPVGLLSICQIAIAASMVGILPLYARIPYWFWNLASILNRSDATYLIFLGLELLLVFGLMIVPTIFLGITLPVATSIASRDVRSLGSSVGSTFAVNTAGTVVGSLAAGLLLVPWIGIRHTMEFGVLVNGLLGTAGMILDTRWQKHSRALWVAGAVAVAALYILFSPQWSEGTLLTGVFRRINSNGAPPSSYANFVRTTFPRSVLYYKEGAGATVGVIEAATPEGKERVLIINGKPDASSIGDFPTEVLLGQVPATLLPDARRALVVGLGSGVTAGTLLRHPLSRLDCVEILPEVVEASSCFEAVNHQPLKDNRFHLFVEDALTYLNLTRESYDIIVSEPSNPWIAGIGNLYSTDFFEQCRLRLSHSGLMVQWFHLYEMDDEAFRLVLRTFQSIFPYVTLWQPLSADVIMVGSQEPIHPSFEAMEASMHLPGVKDELDRIQIPDDATLLSLQAISERTVLRMEGFGETNSEDKPLLEYLAPRAFFINRGVGDVNRFDERARLRDSTLLLAQRIQRRPLTDAERLNIGILHARVNRGNSLLGHEMLAEVLKRNPRNPVVLRALADACDRLNRTEEALRYRKQLALEEPRNADALESYAWSSYTFGRTSANFISGFDTNESERLLRRCMTLAADTVDRYHVLLADIFFDTQRYAEARDEYRAALELRGVYLPDFRIRQDLLLLQLARCYRELGVDDRAAQFALQATQVNPNNEDAKDLIYEIWMKSDLEKRGMKP